MTIKQGYENSILEKPKYINYNVFDSTFSRNLKYKISTLNLKTLYPLDKDEIINMENLCKVMNDNLISSVYNQTINNGVNIIYNLNNNYDGICLCKDFDQCICDNIKIVVYYKGNISITNIKNEYQKRIIIKNRQNKDLDFNMTLKEMYHFLENKN